MSRFGYHYRASSDTNDGPRDVMDSKWVLGAIALATSIVALLATIGWLP